MRTIINWFRSLFVKKQTVADYLKHNKGVQLNGFGALDKDKLKNISGLRT